MDQLQKQVNQVESALKTQQKTKEMKIENMQIKQKIKNERLKSNELKNLALLTIHGINLLGMDNSKTDESILSSLSMIKDSKVFKENEQEEKQTDRVGMLLHKVLREVVNTSTKENINVMDLHKCEQQLVDLFYYAEEEGIIPGVPEGTNWKAQFIEHKKKII